MDSIVRHLMETIVVSFTAGASQTKDLRSAAGNPHAGLRHATPRRCFGCRTLNPRQGPAHNKNRWSYKFTR